jgi:hypothetical protein
MLMQYSVICKFQDNIAKQIIRLQDTDSVPLDLGNRITVPPATE